VSGLLAGKQIQLLITRLFDFERWREKTGTGQNLGRGLLFARPQAALAKVIEIFFNGRFFQGGEPRQG